MTVKRNNLKAMLHGLGITVMAVALSVGYSNCAPATSARSSAQVASSAASCDEFALNQYKTTVYPFFRSPSTCIGCHIEGGVGLGQFASADATVSYQAFNAAGLSKISYMATNPAHKPPFTGIQNQPAIDQINSTWLRTEKEYLECVSKSINGGVDESLLTALKKAPLIYSDANATQTLTWDLDLGADLDDSVKRSIPARITIDVKVLYTTVENRRFAKGYIFANPQMQMKDDTSSVVIEGLFFQINGRPISSQTTFTNLSRVIRGTTLVPLMRANANTLIEPIATQDTIQLYIRRIVPTQGTSDGDPPLTPVLRVGDEDSGSNTHIQALKANVFILRDAGIMRWCLSESPTRPASTEAPCVNSATGPGALNGWSLSRPTSFTFSSGDGDKKLYLWVANESLKINERAAEFTIKLDMTPPQAPSIASVNVTDSQVATMSVSHPSESDVAAWCVFEQNSIRPAPTPPNADDPCWKWTDNSAKPATVGFKGGGSRDVWVFVRDVAGNVSAPSNKVSTTNPFGFIRYSQLTGAVNDPKSVFSNRCLSCHSNSSQPGFGRLELNDYTTASEVARAGTLVSRTNNPISPMPNVNGGLMPQRERDLIRLWSLPQECPNAPAPCQ